MFSITTHRRPAEPVFDRRGYYRSPVTLASYHQGQPAPNKGRKFPAEPLTQREVLALIAACGRAAAGKRDRALIMLLYRTGLRVSEALALYPKDVELDAGRVHVLHGKGDRSRTVGIDGFAAPTIREWLEQRRRLGLTGRHPLFCTISQPTRGMPMHSAYVRNKLHELGQRAGIERRVHPHGLRHTHAFELAGEGMDLRLIQQQLGHSDLATTARYVNHLNPTRLVEAIAERAPLPAPAELSAGAGPPDRRTRSGACAERI